MIESEVNYETIGNPVNPYYSSMGLKLIPLDEALKLNDKTRYRHAAHCLLYCKIIDHSGYFGLGQVRFDGLIGFPGGVVGENDEPLSTLDHLLIGLRRELAEEINYISCEDNSGFVHVSSYLREDINLNSETNSSCNVHHFFMKQITHREFINCELNHTRSIHFPLESVGIFRIPLIDPNFIDSQSDYRFYSIRGTFLINFLSHKFAGTAKGQLFDSLVRLNCMSPNYLAKLKEMLN